MTSATESLLTGFAVVASVERRGYEQQWSFQKDISGVNKSTESTFIGEKHSDISCFCKFLLYVINNLLLTTLNAAFLVTGPPSCTRDIFWWNSPKHTWLTGAFQGRVNIPFWLAGGCQWTLDTWTPLELFKKVPVKLSFLDECPVACV